MAQINKSLSDKILSVKDINGKWINISVNVKDVREAVKELKADLEASAWELMNRNWILTRIDEIFGEKLVK